MTICLEKKVSISSKFNYRLIAMFTLPVDLTYVRSTGFLFPLSKIGISYKVKKHLRNIQLSHRCKKTICCHFSGPATCLNETSPAQFVLLISHPAGCNAVQRVFNYNIYYLFSQEKVLIFSGFLKLFLLFVLW